MLDLKAIAPGFISKHGIETAIQATGAGRSTVLAWKRGAQPKLDYIQRMLEFDPDPLHAVAPLYRNQDPKPGEIVCYTATNRDFPPFVVICREKLFRLHPEVTVVTKTSNFLVRQRNRFAQHFVDSKFEWSLWLDDDVAPLCGDPAAYKELGQMPYFPSAYAGIDMISRFRNSGKTLVGACYFGRAPEGHAMFSEAFGEGLMSIDQGLHNSGPRNELHPTHWLGFGAIWAHRKVFEDVLNGDPSIHLDPDKAKVVGYRYGFFDPLYSGSGEDIAFCTRAKAAGHQPYVDLAMMPAHWGPGAWTWFNTRRLPRVA